MWSEEEREAPACDVEDETVRQIWAVEGRKREAPASSKAGASIANRQHAIYVKLWCATKRMLAMPEEKKMRCVLTIEHTLSLPRDHPLEITHFDSVFALNIFSSTQLIFRNQVCVSYMRCDRPCSKHVVFKRRLQRVFHLLMSTAPKTWKPPPLQRSGSIICLYAVNPFSIL